MSVTPQTLLAFEKTSRNRLDPIPENDYDSFSPTLISCNIAATNCSRKQSKKKKKQELGQNCNIAGGRSSLYVLTELDHAFR